MTKDSDFRRLQTELGAPPQIIWITCGNTSDAGLRKLLEKTFLQAMELLQIGEDLVELS